jgi:hypothetical protein
MGKRGGNKPLQYCTLLNTEEPLNEHCSLQKKKKKAKVGARGIKSVSKISQTRTLVNLSVVLGNDAKFGTIHACCSEAVLAAL